MGFGEFLNMVAPRGGNVGRDGRGAGHGVLT